MIDVAFLTRDLLLALAFLSGGAVWWALRTRELRRRVLALSKRSESELSLHQARLEQLRERAFVLAAFEGPGTYEGRVALVQEGDADLASLEVLREELVGASQGLERAYGRELQAAHRKTEAVGAKVMTLARAMRRHEAIWAAKVARLEAAYSPQPRLKGAEGTVA